MLAVGDVSMGDVVELRATCKTAGESSNMTISAAVLNQARFEQAYQELSASTLELTEFSSTEVAGTIQCDRDGLLYTSIPQNGNWYVEVDGEPAEAVAVGEAMTSVMLTEGTHEVRFFYRNEAFALGWKISLVCLAVFALLVWHSNQQRGRKGKYQNMKKRKY